MTVNNKQITHGRSRHEDEAKRNPSRNQMMQIAFLNLALRSIVYTETAVIAQIDYQSYIQLTARLLPDSVTFTANEFPTTSETVKWNHFQSYLTAGSRKAKLTNDYKQDEEEVEENDFHEKEFDDWKIAT